MTDPIQRSPDGSIDARHYIALGHKARSEQAARLLRAGRGPRAEDQPPLPEWYLP